MAIGVAGHTGEVHPHMVDGPGRQRIQTCLGDVLRANERRAGHYGDDIGFTHTSAARPEVPSQGPKVRAIAAPVSMT
jgi:hypothetical protein